MANDEMDSSHFKRERESNAAANRAAVRRAAARAFICAVLAVFCNNLRKFALRKSLISRVIPRYSAKFHSEKIYPATDAPSPGFRRRSKAMARHDGATSGHGLTGMEKMEAPKKNSPADESAKRINYETNPTTKFRNA
jgi:hypothetical protein